MHWIFTFLAQSAGHIGKINQKLYFLLPGPYNNYRCLIISINWNVLSSHSCFSASVSSSQLKTSARSSLPRIFRLISKSPKYGGLNFFPSTVRFCVMLQILSLTSDKVLSCNQFREIDWTWSPWLYPPVTRGEAVHSWCPPGGGRGPRGGLGSRRASCPRSWWRGRAPPPPGHQRARPCQLEIQTKVREDFTITEKASTRAFLW